MKRTTITLFLVALAYTQLQAQNVGIGTITPGYKLTLIADGIGLSQESSSGGAKIGFYTNGNTAYLQTHNNTNLNFSTANSNAQMVLRTNGYVGIGVGTPINKLQIGVTPTFTDNDIAIGNGTQQMSMYQAPTVSIFYTNTNFAFMPSGGAGNVGIGTTAPVAKLDVLGSMRVSESGVALGTIFKQIQAGTKVLGPSNGGNYSGVTASYYIIYFPNAFTTPPHIVVTPRTEANFTYPDTFSFVVQSVTNTSALVRLQHNDGNGGNGTWAQQLELDWIAFSY